MEFRLVIHDLDLEVQCRTPGGSWESYGGELPEDVYQRIYNEAYPPEPEFVLEDEYFPPLDLGGPVQAVGGGPTLAELMLAYNIRSKDPDASRLRRDVSLATWTPPCADEPLHTSGCCSCFGY